MDLAYKLSSCNDKISKVVENQYTLEIFGLL